MKTILEIEEKTGRWSVKEHKKFIEAINTFGRNWKQIALIIKTRSSSQVRSHAQKFFIKEANKQGLKPKKVDHILFETKSTAITTDAGTQYGEDMLFPVF